MSAPFLRLLLAVFLVATPVAVVSAQALRVVARVNDDAITDFELKQRITFAIRTTGLQDTPDLRQQRLAQQLLRQMIDERLQIQNAKGLGVRPDRSRDQPARRRDRALGAACSAASSSSICRASASPTRSPRSRSKPRIAWAKIVRRRVRPQVEVSDAEIDDALARIRANVGKTESRVAEIFVPIDKVDQADEAKRSADRIDRAAEARRALRGARAAILARRHGADRRRPRLDPARLARSRARCGDREAAARARSPSRSARRPAGTSSMSSTAAPSPRRGPTTCASTSCR